MNQWTADLKRLHCLYKSESALISLNGKKSRIEKTVDILLSQTINTFDDACVNAMNIARDDVAGIRASLINTRPGRTSNTPYQHAGVGGSDETPIVDYIDAPVANDEAPLTLRYCYEIKQQMVAGVIAPTNTYLEPHT